MKQHIIPILSLVLTLLYGCSSGRYVSLDELQKGSLQEGAVCVITKPWDLQGKTVSLPKNSTLIFKEGGSIKNGTLTGDNTKIKYKTPFIGESVTVNNCKIVGKRIVRDNEVFLSVKHSQNEIQTLFNISGGKKLVFSKGEYQNIEKIVINNNIQADFSGSTIALKYNNEYVAECFYMEPWFDKQIDFVKIKNLKIKGKLNGVNGTKARRCIQLFHVSEVELDNISIDDYYGGPEEFKSGDLLDKSRIGTSAIAIMCYDRCVINNCSTNNISKEIFWCVPNTNPRNITYFTNNKSTCSSKDGSSSFFTILDGRCVVKGNEVHNYNGSAFNAFCYDSEISYNKFYAGKRSVAIDLSEGTMYRAKNVTIHDNYCYNTKDMVWAYGEGIKIKKNHWTNNALQQGERIYVVNISTRTERVKDGKYIGCDNNPEMVSGSKDVVIENNVIINEGGVKDDEIRFALLYGENIKVADNTITGCNVPVVQLVDGEDFVYCSNTIIDSKKGYYAELLINRGKNITIAKNVFSQNNTSNNLNCTAQVAYAEGHLVYKKNFIDTNAPDFDKSRPYIPCFIRDCSKLDRVDYSVKGICDDIDIKTGLPSGRIKIKTNISN